MAAAETWAKVKTGVVGGPSMAQVVEEKINEWPMIARSKSNNSLYILPSMPHSASVIFLHGMGETPETWLDLLLHWAKLMPHIKFILAPAPTKTVTFSQCDMPAWFDIKTLRPLACSGMDSSRDAVAKLIKAEHMLQIPYSRILLAGFSQGAALALYTGLRVPVRMGGILSMGGFLPKTFAVPPGAALTTVLLLHGAEDEIIPMNDAKKIKVTLVNRGVDERGVDFKVVQGLGHAVNTEVANVAQKFLEKRLAPLPDGQTPSAMLRAKRKSSVAAKKG